MQQANIQAQSQSLKHKLAEKIAMAEVQKQEAISGSKVQSMKKLESELEIQIVCKLQAQLDQQKMMQQHKNDMELAKLQEQGTNIKRTTKRTS